MIDALTPQTTADWALSSRVSYREEKGAIAYTVLEICLLKALWPLALMNRLEFPPSRDIWQVTLYTST